jgi:hypothetical protein
MAVGNSSAKVYDTIQLTLGGTPGRRCRLQGLSDASLHFGWIKDYVSGSMVIEVKSKKPLKHGDFFCFEVSGAANLLTFVGFITRVTEQAVTIQVTSEIEERELKSESRLRILPFTGVLTMGNTSAEIKVIEISEEGFGFETFDSHVNTGFKTAILNSKHGSINTDVAVMHVRTDRETGDRRGGARIKTMDRISKARWLRLFVE